MQSEIEVGVVRSEKINVLSSTAYIRVLFTLLQPVLRESCRADKTKMLAAIFPCAKSFGTVNDRRK